MSLFVLDPGLASRVVDLGRPSSRSLGVPVGGAADRGALILGNALVGNPPHLPALEVCLKGPVLRADVPLGCVVFGAAFTLASARQALRVGATFSLGAGEEVHIGGTREEMRAYLCVRGGIQAPEILGSSSSLEPLEAGETLACAPSAVRKHFFPEQVIQSRRGKRGVLHVLAGLQADWFDETAFYAQEYEVTPALNRMGIRLQAQPLPLPDRELVSEPVCPGAVQVTRDGQCIVLGVDGQTIGGYPKIAQVIGADLDQLGQLRPGDRLRFRQVQMAEAFTLFEARQAFLLEWSRRARLSLDGW